MGPDALERYRSLIVERITTLEEIAGASRDAGAVVELDQARIGRLSRMDALQQQAMARATEGRRREELARLRGALARIASGEFGYCESCDEPISPGRLAFDPGAPLCIACAQRQ